MFGRAWLTLVVRFRLARGRQAHALAEFIGAEEVGCRPHLVAPCVRLAAFRAIPSGCRRAFERSGEPVLRKSFGFGGRIRTTCHSERAQFARDFAHSFYARGLLGRGEVNAAAVLAADVAKQLNVDLGRANVGRFSDGEVSVELLGIGGANG